MDIFAGGCAGLACALLGRGHLLPGFLVSRMISDQLSSAQLRSADSGVRGAL